MDWISLPVQDLYAVGVPSVVSGNILGSDNTLLAVYTYLIYVEQDCLDGPTDLLVPDITTV